MIRLKFDKIMQTKSYTVVILKGEEKKFAIYTDPSIGKTLQLYLTGIERPRPLTHDLMESLFQGFGIQVMQVVINDIQDTIYFARLYLEQKCDGVSKIVEIDCRPSDCITIALMSNAPVYCTKEVLEKTIAVEE